MNETMRILHQYGKRYVDIESLIEFLNNNSNPCMKCGSVQCAVCSDDLIKELRGE